LNHEEGKRQYHLIEIKDNGIGFPQKDAERIFNVFTRLHSNEQAKGTGVGLSIVRKVVENHGGYIWAESEPGMGATFKMLLPVN
jgi:signal transduction histidine kinase